MRLSRVELDMLLEDPDYLDAIALKDGRVRRSKWLGKRDTQPCALCGEPTKLKSATHQACARRRK